MIVTNAAAVVRELAYKNNVEINRFKLVPFRFPIFLSCTRNAHFHIAYHMCSKLYKMLSAVRVSVWHRIDAGTRRYSRYNRSTHCF